MTRRLISLLALTLFAVSCGVSGEYGTAQRFQCFRGAGNQDNFIHPPMTDFPVSPVKGAAVFSRSVRKASEIC